MFVQYNRRWLVSEEVLGRLLTSANTHRMRQTVQPVGGRRRWHARQAHVAAGALQPSLHSIRNRCFSTRGLVVTTMQPLPPLVAALTQATRRRCGYMRCRVTPITLCELHMQIHHQVDWPPAHRPQMVLTIMSRWLELTREQQQQEDQQNE